MTNKYSMFTEELKPKIEKQIREVTEKSDNALLLLRMGLSVRALILGICITLFLLVLLNLA